MIVISFTNYSNIIIANYSTFLSWKEYLWLFPDLDFESYYLSEGSIGLLVVRRIGALKLCFCGKI